jgi:hypothetical protein
MKFSDFAVEKMLDMYKNHSNQVGIKVKQAHPEKYKNYVSMDCITYVLTVLKYAYEKVGDPNSQTVFSDGIAPSGHFKGKYVGMILAEKLVKQRHWDAIYVNPDVVHPVDALQEHNFTYYQANKLCRYHKVPVKYTAVNYNTTAKTHENFQELVPHRGETKLNRVDYDMLKKIKFGLGMSKGGTHTWLFSKGYVFEVHWENTAPTLYEKSPLDTFGYLDSIIMVPPDGKSFIALDALKCSKTKKP